MHANQSKNIEAAIDRVDSLTKVNLVTILKKADYTIAHVEDEPELLCLTLPTCDNKFTGTIIERN